MDHGPLSLVAETFPWVCAEALLHAWGTDVPCGRRQRRITPWRVGLALTATCARPRVEPIADWPGGFQALLGTTIPSKAFSQQVAKPHGAAVARPRTARRLRERTRTGLGGATGPAGAACRPLVRPDGRSLAIHARVRAGCPGRCTAVQPAAVALPPTLDRLGDAPTTVVLPPDTTSAQACVPEPPALRDRVRVADRGSLEVPSLRRVHDAGGGVLLRAQAGRPPPVLDAGREDGQRVHAWRHQALPTLHAPRPQRQRVARSVPWYGMAPRCVGACCAAGIDGPRVAALA